MEYSTLLAAYGLSPDSLSDERNRQIKDILNAGGAAAGRKILEIIQQEAYGRGLPSGTQGSDAQKQAEAIAQAEIDRQEAEAAAKKRRTTLLIIGGAVVVLIGGIIAFLNRKKS